MDETTEKSPAQISVAPTRYIHWLLLAALIVMGFEIRLRDIDRQSLWFDEFYSVFLSTGRGEAGSTPCPMVRPHGVVLPPIPTGFVGAPPWWRIWSGMGSAFHPPLYHIVLRWWIDRFGWSDFSVRMCSAFFSLAGVVVLFDIVRRRQGPWVALCAAGLMTAASVQFVAGQETRSYTLLVFLGLLVVWELLRIQSRGPTSCRLTMLALAAGAMALTHYLAAGALAALGLYVLIAWRGPLRRRTFCVLLATGAAVFALWAKSLFGGLHEIWGETQFLADPHNPLVDGCKQLFYAPFSLTLDLGGHWREVLAWPIFAMVFVVPLLHFRKHPDVALWWTWVVGSLGFPLLVDLKNHYQMLVYWRYIFLASPGVYALLSTPIVRARRWVMIFPAALLLVAAIGTMARPPLEGWKDDDWRLMAGRLQESIKPGDVLVVTTCDNFHPEFTYIVMNRYGDFSGNPVVFLGDEPLEPQTLQSLAKSSAIWVVGYDPAQTTHDDFPGWQFDPPICGSRANYVWEVFPPGNH